jgi:formate hydrogenlyase subunit 4
VVANAQVLADALAAEGMRPVSGGTDSHLALIDLTSSLKLLLYASLIICVFAPWGMAPPGASPQALAAGFAAYLGKLAVAGFLLAVFETAIAKMRIFRVPEFLGAALMLGLLATLLLFVSRSL